MDPPSRSWLLEYLCLQSSIPDSLIRTIIRHWPVSDSSSRVKIMLLLKTIKSEVSEASVTELVLDMLEVAEQLYRSDSIAITESMKDAYCAVALECTLKHLAAYPHDYDGYLPAVKRIWRDKFQAMENVNQWSELVSEKFLRWRHVIEAALWNPEVCEILAEMSTRRAAINEVGGYLEEAWRMMQRSFIESLAGDILARDEVATDISAEGSDMGVNDLDQDTEATNNGIGMVSEPTNETEGMQVMVFEPMNEGEGREGLVSKPMEEGEVMVSKLIYEDGMAFETGNQGDGIAAEPKKGRIESSTDTRCECGASDRIELDNDAACLGEAPVMDCNQVNEKDEERVLNSSGGSVLSRREKRDVQKSILQLKHKHVASHRCFGGVKITGAGEVGKATSSTKYDTVRSPKVKEVQESLKSSSLEQAFIKYPLPDALHMPETVICELSMKDINHEPPTKQRRIDVDVPDLHNANNCNVDCPSLMEWNSTAHTYKVMTASIAGFINEVMYSLKWIIWPFLLSHFFVELKARLWQGQASWLHQCS